MNNTVSIATKPLVYSAFRYISNKAYNALAEYVDNSIQSYLDNKDILCEINPAQALSVYINIDIDNDTIVIEDDAFGITDFYYEKAFELANIPLDASGLNEFGMGMKVSSIWCANLWMVETSAYGEPYSKILVFDLDEVVKNEKLALDVKYVPCKKDDHYTRVTLRKLSQNKPSNRQIGTIKKHLASIYTKYIRDGVLNLYVNDELQSVDNLAILREPYFKNPQGKKILWKKSIKFEAPRIENGIEIGKYSVKGFVGILEKMSTSTDNGFLLFRHGRVIGSSYDTKYRPKELCGEEGSPRYKRIFGELELDGFKVSFTKNAFTEDDEFETFIHLLAQDLSNDKDFDLFGQAQNYRKPVKVVTKKNAESLTASLTDEINNTSIKTIASESSTPGLEIDDIEENPEVEETTLIDNPSKATIKIDDESFDLEVGWNAWNTTEGLYKVEKVSDNEYRSSFNLKNPFFERFSDAINSKDGIAPILHFIKTMVSTEIVLMNSGDDSGSRFRNKFNKLFGKNNE